MDYREFEHHLYEYETRAKWLFLLLKDEPSPANP